MSEAHEQSIFWAQAAIDAHSKAANGFEGGDDIQVWQLMVSLVRFSRDHGIDLQTTLNEAEDHVDSQVLNDEHSGVGPGL